MYILLQGTRSALYANDRESITVTLQEVTPRSAGALVALYERAVGIYASLININAYHQPGIKTIFTVSLTHFMMKHSKFNSYPTANCYSVRCGGWKKSSRRSTGTSETGVGSVKRGKV